jgi:hypothetical protein
MEQKAANKTNKPNGRRGIDFHDKKFDTIHDRNSMLILEMVSGLKKDTWEEAFKEFNETNDLHGVRSFFSDILTVLLETDEKHFPESFPRLESIAYLAQIYNLIEVFFKKYLGHSTDNAEAV